MARNRRRVGIERIIGDAARQVSFSKRRQGLFKKVCELSTLCGAESAVLVHSPAGRVYSLGDPDVLTVVDRFLEYASPPALAAPGGAEQRETGAGHRRPQQQHHPRGAAPQEGRRRLLEEELYRQLAEQETWGEAARAHRAALVAAMKEKEELLPHRWGANVQDLALQEAEEMADALEELALRVGDLIRDKEEEEGVPREQRWSPDDPALPPSNPWRQAAFMASLGHAAPWGAASAAMVPAAADNPAMAGGFNVPFGAPAFGASTSAVPMNQAAPGPFAVPAAPSLGAAGMLPVVNNQAAPGFMAASGGMGVPMASVAGSSLVGLENMVGANPFGIGPSSSFSRPANTMMQAGRDGEGTSTGLGPHGTMFY